MQSGVARPQSQHQWIIRNRHDAGWEWVWMLGINLMQRRGKVKGASGRGCINEMQGGWGFRSALLRHELTQDGASRFGIGKGCSGMVLKTQEWHRHVRMERMRAGMVTVMTDHVNDIHTIIADPTIFNNTSHMQFNQLFGMQSPHSGSSKQAGRPSTTHQYT